MPRGRVIALVATSLVAVIVVGFVYGSVLWKRIRGVESNGAIANVNQVRPITNTHIPTRTNQQMQGAVVDSDGDGLLDTEEASLETDPTRIDTDADGLTDRQEVEIYHSDPKNADSDGDSYEDGEEVRNFYNPNGKGRLLEVIDAINQLENSNVNQ